LKTIDGSQMTHCAKQPQHARIGFLLLSLLLLTCFVFAATSPPTLTLEDFEQGVGKWVLNDHLKTPTGQATLCDIISTASGAPSGGGKRSATITFKRSAEGWATVSLPVSGKQWQNARAQRITFWLRGDGSDNAVEVMLRASPSPNAPDEAMEMKFSVEVPLGDTQWHKVTLPLPQFQSDGVAATEKLEQIYLLQFLKRTKWESLFFSVDQIQIEGAPATPPTNVTPRPPVAGKRVNVTADFSRVLGNTTVSISTNFEGEEERLSDATFKESLRNFGARFVRVKISRWVKVDTSGDTPTWDFSALDRIVSAVREANAEPFICLSNRPEWKLTDDQFLNLCADTVLHLNDGSERKITYFEIFDEPTFGPNAISIEQATTLFNQARQRIKELDASFRVGGVALASAWQPHLVYFLRNAQGVDFLSFYFYGTHNGVTPDVDLLDTARRTVADDVPNQISLSDLRRTMAQMKLSNVPIFISECNLNSIRAEDRSARDRRLMAAFAAPWWMNFLKSAGMHVNHVIASNAGHETWGLLDDKGRAYPAYYALWLYSKFFPAGSSLVSAQSDSSSVLSFAVNTLTAHNVMLVNLSDKPATCRLTAKGFTTLRQVRGRFLEPMGRGIRFEENMPPNATHDVALPAYGVAVVQFIEPPKEPQG
jgi:hypothetical protein